MMVRSLERLTWRLIYGGLGALSLGWFVRPREGPWGEVMLTGGAIAVVVGVVLIVVRSRMEP
jgi:hypothetical protein